MRRLLGLLLCVLLIFVFASCSSENSSPTPSEFLSVLESKVEHNLEKTRKEYENQQCTMTVKVGWLSQDGAVNTRSEHLSVKIYLPESETENLRYGDVITVTGELTTFEKDDEYTKVEIENARIISSEYTVNGEIAGIYTSKKYGKYLSLRSEEIISDSEQINILVSDEMAEQYEIGEYITAHGKLKIAPLDMGTAILHGVEIHSDILNMMDASVEKISQK